MVDAASVTNSFNPITYIQQLNSNITAANKAVDASTAGTTAAALTTSGSTTSASATSADSSTSASSVLGLSPAVLSALQGGNSSTGGLIGSLLGNSSSSSSTGDALSSLFSGSTSAVSSTDPLAGVYNGLLNKVSETQPYQQAISAAQQQQSEAQATANSNPVESVLNAFTNATNAYNQTLQQNAQAVIAANNFQADGKTPLVA